jgi:hypothetical protein
MPISNALRTVTADGDLHVNVSDLISHLERCCESVTGMCMDINPTGTRIVTDTINVTIETLRELP